MAQEGFGAAARHLDRGVRGRAAAPYEPPPRDPEWDAAEPGLVESEAPFELVAEAIRAYLTNPNYLKTFAPDAAAAIRAMVNSHPQLAKWIQFNGLAGLAAVRGGIGATGGDDPNSRRQRIDERPWDANQ